MSIIFGTPEAQAILEADKKPENPPIVAICRECQEEFVSHFDDIVGDYEELCPNCSAFYRQVDAWEEAQEQKFERGFNEWLYGVAIVIG